MFRPTTAPPTITRDEAGDPAGAEDHRAAGRAQRGIESAGQPPVQVEPADHREPAERAHERVQAAARDRAHHRTRGWSSLLQRRHHEKHHDGHAADPGGREQNVNRANRQEHQCGKGHGRHCSRTIGILPGIPAIDDGDVQREPIVAALEQFDRQPIVHSVSEVVSFTKIRLPEMAGCAQVALSATV